VCSRLRDLHETLASSFNKVKAQCMPFSNKGVIVEKMINWVGEEIKAVLDTLWRLNDNFVVLDIESVLNMLHSEECQELSRLHGLAASRDAVVLENVPKDVCKQAGRIVRRWWKPHGLPEALRGLEAATLKL
jgi:hypothetical protein